jgi:outer membrane protein assembly factor BamD
MGKLMRMNLKLIFNFLGLLLIILLCSCSTSNFSKDMSAKERFSVAVQQYSDGSYDNAIENLRVLSYDRSLSFADSVQYILAECYFMREQYLLAASEYKDLIRFQSNSTLVPEARYKVGLSYASISPKIALDQNYSIKAMAEFQTFIEYYPTHTRVRDAERKMIEIRNKMAKKEFDIAMLYQNMGRARSALVYFQGVLERYHDSEFADQASYWIVQIFVSQKKYTQAKIEIERFLQKYPNSTKKEEINDVKKKIENF